MAVDKYADEIKKTGFHLEYKVGALLQSEKWKIISNKYYIDDQEETVREIDLVAYKSAKIEDTNTYTVLIVSCKKSDSNIWALLSRPIDTNDQNTDFNPTHAWTNYKTLQHQISKSDWPKNSMIESIQVFQMDH